MYLYFDRQGNLKEQINDEAIRQGNQNINKLYIFWEDAENRNTLGVWYRFVSSASDGFSIPKNVQTPIKMSNTTVTQTIPYDPKRDLKYFKYSQPYKFYVVDFENDEDVLNYGNVSWLASLWFVVDKNNDPEDNQITVEDGEVISYDDSQIDVIGMGAVAFFVAGVVQTIVGDENISLAQWNYLIGLYTTWEQHQHDLDDKITELDTKVTELDGTVDLVIPRIEALESEITTKIDEVKINDVTQSKSLVDNKVIVSLDLSAYATNLNLKTYAKSLEVSINQSTYVATFNLKDADGNIISTQTLDFPIESMVVSGSYDNQTKSIILTLQNGNTTSIPVGDLVDGLVSNTQLTVILGDYYTKTQVYNKTEITSLLNDYVLKEVGKGLTTNDYTNEDKNFITKIKSNFSTIETTNDTPIKIYKTGEDDGLDLYEIEIGGDYTTIMFYDSTYGAVSFDDLATDVYNNKTNSAFTYAEISGDDTYTAKGDILLNSRILSVNDFSKIYSTTDQKSLWQYLGDTFQLKLIGSGTGQNIKTINGSSILGSGDIGVIETTKDDKQTITNTNTSKLEVLTLRSSYTNAKSFIGFQDGTTRLMGWIGAGQVASGQGAKNFRPLYMDVLANIHNIALEPDNYNIKEVVSNDSDQIREFEIQDKTNTYTIVTVKAPSTQPKEATACLKVENSGTNNDETYFMDISVMNYGNVDEEPEESIYLQSRNASVKPRFNIGWTDETQTRHKKLIINPDALPMMFTSTGIWVKNTNDPTVHGWANRTEVDLRDINANKTAIASINTALDNKVDKRTSSNETHLYAYGVLDGGAINDMTASKESYNGTIPIRDGSVGIKSNTIDSQSSSYDSVLVNIEWIKNHVALLQPDGVNQNYDNSIYQIYGHMPLQTAQGSRNALEYCFNVSNTPSQATIPQYDSNSNLKSSTPVANNDVATKQYVDNHSPSITPELLGYTQNSGIGNLQFNFDVDLTTKQGLGVFTYGNCNILINLYGLTVGTTYYQNCIYRKSGATTTTGLRNGMLSYSYYNAGNNVMRLTINLYTINSDGTIGSIDTSATQYTAYLFLVNLK